MNIVRVTASDDIDNICLQMSPDNWAADNEMTQYRPDALRRFVADDRNVLMVMRDKKVITGSALAYIILHPEGKTYMYVHELDTHPSYRRQGIAGKLMKELFLLAKHRKCDELWLDADKDNNAANKLYVSLKPSDIDPSVTYSYKLIEKPGTLDI